jgi:short-subunit dehydrogenase
VDGMIKHRGGVLNVASVAGFMPGPGMAVYYASKAYVLSFTEALSRELSPFGVRVTALCPGPVKTEFQMRAGIDARQQPPRFLRLTPAQVAEAGYQGFMAGKRLVIPGLGNKIMSMVPRFVSRGFMLQTIESHQRNRGRRAEGWRKPPKP